MWTQWSTHLRNLGRERRRGQSHGPPRAGGAWGETFNIGCGERITVNLLIATIGEILGTQIDPEFAPSRAGDVRHSLASIQKAERLLGYRVVRAFSPGLAETIAWFRKPAPR